ncbi:FAD-dependent oxidoreductase [Jannaschia sp. W003]|uniref:GcvT family protein n=1 Tax=Jannaschia sp. W003 TaxID=2867012 RepID=UPI0021A77B39|nr:FAD-dependent oxidoreductase [Jannaschia sp. W003]UWQ20583.1 FAD-dependent oxidoreductase [Jannaschia sp. W003]
MTPPTTARVVVIGGGVVGCSVAYHLAKLGWNPVLLERKRLTSGTTWHAAGLIAQLRATPAMTRLAKYSQELYGTLESETGVATGFRRCGSITVALTPARAEEIRRQAGMARAWGVEVEEIGAADVKACYPHLRTDDVQAAVWLPKDGQGDPANIAHALAKGARQNGAQVFENTALTGVRRQGDRVTHVEWRQGEDTGTIACDHVVNCGGMWARDLGWMLGANVPLQACEHFYIVTEAIENLGTLPVLRVPDECAYYKEDAGKMLLGAFEPVAKPWGPIPEDFEFDQLPEDFDHFEPILERAVARMPMLESAGIHTFFNGPESFTPDDAYHLGPCPGTANVWVAAGFNSIGIQSAGGAGLALSQWMEGGEMPFDLVDVDVARMEPFQGNRRYLRERASETLGLLYADHFPFRQKATARGVRRSPIHRELLDRGAVMGELAGWERANWFAREGQAAVYDYDWHRPAWWENRRAEHMAVREGVGLYDMSSFGKLRIEGRDALRLLLIACGAEMDVAAGRIVYTQMLNARGGIEADVTVTRLSETAFLMVTPAATRLRDETRLRRLAGNMAVTITDVTAGEAVMAVMGPDARAVLADACADDMSDAAQPFGTARNVELGLGLARLHRVSYVGELGYEVYVSADMAAHAFETLVAAGDPHGLRLVGLHAMDTLRMEKAFRHMGHDITPEDHVVEAGLAFACRKSGDYVGANAVAAKRESGPARRLLQFRLRDPEPELHHAEPILRDGEMVGHLTSGGYGHALGAAVGLGYVPCAGEKVADLVASQWEIEIAGTRVAAEASLRPMYDPTGERMRA